MSENTRLPRSVLAVALALFAGFAVLAALHLSDGQAPKAPLMDPREPDALAPDVTSEFGGHLKHQVNLAKIDAAAVQQLGPRPERLSPQSIQEMAPTSDGESRVSAALRIREIRKREGPAAALAALKALPSPDAR